MFSFHAAKKNVCLKSGGTIQKYKSLRGKAAL